MIADTQRLEKSVIQIRELSPEYRLRLIQRITETLIPSSVSPESKPLQFGKYKGNKMSKSLHFLLHTLLIKHFVI